MLKIKEFIKGLARRPLRCLIRAPGLAGLAVGFWAGEDELCSLWKLDRRFEPRMDEERRAALLHQWHRAVKRAAGWIE